MAPIPHKLVTRTSQCDCSVHKVYAEMNKNTVCIYQIMLIKGTLSFKLAFTSGY